MAKAYTWLINVVHGTQHKSLHTAESIYFYTIDRYLHYIYYYIISIISLHYIFVQHSPLGRYLKSRRLHIRLPPQAGRQKYIIHGLSISHMDCISCMSVQCCPSESLSVWKTVHRSFSTSFWPKHTSSLACQAYAWAKMCVYVCLCSAVHQSHFQSRRQQAYIICGLSNLCVGDIVCVCVCAVLSIRGTLSLEDCVTDFMCEPVDLDDWIKEVDNAATPRSFSDRIPEVKAASKPSHSLNHSTHG